MKISGLKRLSREDIDAKVEQIIGEWFPDYYKHGLRAFPLLEMCEKLKSFQVRIELNAILNNTANGKKILGCYTLDPKCIYVDQSLQNTPRQSFVLAHEIGHVVLHRKIKLPNTEAVFTDTEERIFGQKEFLNDYDWMEWQANAFAGALLMPSRMFKAGLIKTQKSLDINRTGIIYVNNAGYSKNDYHNTLEGLSKLFHVSKSSVKYRLKDLKLIEFGPGVENSHISQYLT